MRKVAKTSEHGANVVPVGHLFRILLIYTFENINWTNFFLQRNNTENRRQGYNVTNTSEYMGAHIHVGFLGIKVPYNYLNLILVSYKLNFSYEPLKM